MYALNEVADNANLFHQAVQTGRPFAPLYVKLKLVWHCNLRCVMCNHWREKRPAPLPLSTLISLVDDLAELGCRKIHISGGEPTLYTDLVPLVEHIALRGLKVNITSNGILLSKTLSRELAQAGLSAANISIDSPTAKIHDRTRGAKGSWKKTVKGFRRLQRAMTTGEVRINTVVGRTNYKSLGNLAAFAADLGADAINLIPMDNHTGEGRVMSKRVIRDYNQHIAPIIAEQGLALGLIKDAREAYPFGIADEEIARSRHGRYALGFYDTNRCFAPWTHALINHDGKVSICCMLRDKPVMGDLRTHSFAEIWYGETYRFLRMREGLPLFSACRQCDDFLAQNRLLNGLLETPSA